ncbi:MAG TPA: hypothetical protein VKY36_01725 [Moheibacter sp.]|nr:hypothetical protein [Moheibacter sp.]
MNSEIESIKERNYTISYNRVFGESWNLYTKLIGVGALAVIIYSIFSFLVSFLLESITGFRNVTNEFMMDIQGMQDPNALLYELQDFYRENLNSILITRLGTEFIMLLAFPLAGGFMMVCREMDKNGAFNMGTLFEGFKPQYWGRLMVLAIIYFFVSKVATMFFLLPGIYIWVAAVIACPIVMFTNANGIQAFATSIKLVNKNWFTVFQILLVASLIGVAGYLLCFVGRIVAYPLVLVTVYMLYKHIVGFNDEKIDEIGHS